MRLILSLSITCAVVFGLVACGDSGSSEQLSDAVSSARDNGGSSSAADQTESTNPVCGLLSIDEIESAIGQVVIGVDDTGSYEGFGACTWRFEPLADGGLFDGTEPELLIQTFATTETYDAALIGYPDQPAIDGIGDGAMMRAEGEITFIANGHSGRLGTFFLFDVEEQDIANAAGKELAALIASRL